MKPWFNWKALSIGFALFASIAMSYRVATAQQSPPSPALAAVAQPKPPSQDANAEGVTVEITSLKRTSGDSVTVRCAYLNSGSNEQNLKNMGGVGSMDDAYLIDGKNKKKYLVVKDSDGNPLVGAPAYGSLPAGKRTLCWARFPAPPPDVGTVSVFLPGAPPFEDVPIEAP
jgi:hypothetical protein